jgi:hypothetical protein
MAEHPSIAKKVKGTTTNNTHGITSDGSKFLKTENTPPLVPHPLSPLK